MYLNQNNLIKPDTTAIVWRYITRFEHLKELIETKSLYFPNASTFKETDAYDSKWYKSNVKAWNMRNADFAKILKEDVASDASQDSDALQRSTYVNCWTVRDDESLRMWRRKIESGMGFAIQTTYKRLEDSLHNKQNLFFSKVQYADGRYAITKLRSFTYFVFFKKKKFAYEKELRIVHLNKIYEEKRFPVDLGTLIQKIVVTHRAYTEYSASIRDLLAENGIADKPIYKSKFVSI